MIHSTAAQYRIEMVSDTICPWCYIGLHRLKKALAQLPSGVGSFVIQHRPFELNPDMPIEGIDRKQYRSTKFGSWERSLVLDAQVADAGRAEGIGFRHDLADRTPNTLASHALLHLASEEGLQDAVMEAVFRGYFVEGKDIGKPEVLASLGLDAGMAPDRDLESRLRSPALRSRIAREARATARSGLRGVPAFFLKGKALVSGAQPPAVLATAIHRVLARTDRDEA